MSKARDLANAGTALTTVSATELGYLDGVTSAVQTQINSKIGQSTAINPTIVDAKGDLIVGSAADTVIRKPVGTDGQLLYADSTATGGVKWDAAPASGSMTLLSTTTLSGSSTTISSISQSYKNLYVLIYGINNFQSRTYAITTNAGANITQQAAACYGTINGGSTNGTNNGDLRLTIESNLALTSTTNSFEITFFNYANTVSRKVINGVNYYTNTDPQDWVENYSGIIKTTSAISSLTIETSGGSMSAGTVLIYGVN